MRRKLTSSRTLAAALAVALMQGAPTVAQQDFSGVEFDVQHVAGSVYVLISGRGGNIAVSSGADGALMVDDQFAPLAEKIRAALREIGRSEVASDVKFLINTHWHGDHTGGNVEFGPESVIIAHANVRERLSTPQDRGGRITQPAPEAALPVITFDQGLAVHFNGEEIHVIHIPNGHTDGDAVIHFTGSNVVHMGDDFFAGRFPFVDLASGGSVEGLERGIALAIEHIPADAAVIPGHGPLSSVDDLKTYHRMLRETIAMVRSKMDQGTSMEEIQRAGVSEEWRSWGEGEVFIDTERWLGTIYQSLAGSADGDYGISGAADPSHGRADREHGHEGHAPALEGHEHGHEGRGHRHEGHGHEGHEHGHASRGHDR